MLKIQFKECCRECSYLDIKCNTYETTRINGKRCDLTSVSCRHAPVCKAYSECDEQWNGKSQT